MIPYHHFGAIGAEVAIPISEVLIVIHVIISLIGIGSGFVVMYGMLAAKWLEAWTQIFLWTTVATSATGFILPAHHFLPSHAVGILSLLVLPVAFYARYGRSLAGSWRWIYVVTAMLAQYLNVFVLVVQSFLKVPALKSLAPTQTEPPFKLTQLVVLVLFIVLTAACVVKFRVDEPPMKPVL